MARATRFAAHSLAALLWLAGTVADCRPSGAGTVGSRPSGVAAEQPERVDFATADGGRVHGDLYGPGDHAVVLAHGRVFDKESWRGPARRLQGAGFTVLAIDFRGYGDSVAGDAEWGLAEDVLASIRFLHDTGAERVSVVGASMGGGAAAIAATRARPGEIDRLVLLAPAPIEAPEAIVAGSILYLVSREEPLAPTVVRQFEQAPEPKRLEWIDGDAHAQHVFKTEQGFALLETIVGFLTDDDHS